MKDRLIAMMARLIARQDRTWGQKRGRVSEQYFRLCLICDKLDFDPREIVKAAELNNGYSPVGRRPTDEQKRRFHATQLKDVIEMQAIYEAAAQGMEAAMACKEVLGGWFELSATTAEGVLKHVNACE